MTTKEWEEILEPADRLIKWLREPGRSRLRIQVSPGGVEVYDIYEEMSAKAAKEMSKELRREILSTSNETNLGFSKKTLLKYIAAAETALSKEMEEGEEYT